MKILLLILSVLTVPSYSQSNKQEMVGRISHHDMPKAISLHSIFDEVNGNHCLSVSGTRRGGGAATETVCYKSSIKPVLGFSNNGYGNHADVARAITFFKIADETNSKNCYGSFITRRKGGASISLKCL